MLRGSDVVLTVRLTPKSARDEIEGASQLSDGRAVLKARVRAAPRDGEANAALIKLVAKSLRLAPSAVRVEAGATGRLKTLCLTGDPETLQQGLAELAARSAGA
ncbi:hypothetical protein CR492_01620 [Methylocella silvestris]|uniref:UPF0235 protein CR492_01620 n=2 Tax=Methylocella silvestris TaxID=199596 RepID=A0A2J7TLJ6_METSI|nr:hypothetical protein CR492_01620 [Methylocella silvestris]